MSKQTFSPHTRRLLLSGVVLTLVALLIWQARRDEPPPDTSDFDVDYLAIPADDNAYTYWRDLDSQIRVPDVDRFLDWVRGSNWNAVAVTELLADNAPVFTSIARGLECTAYQAPRITNPATLTVKWSAYRKAARLMKLKARLHLTTGEYRETADSAAAFVHFGDMISRRPESLIQFLVGSAISRMGYATCRHLAWEDGIDASLCLEAADHLDARMLDNEPLIRAFKREYAFFEFYVDGCASGQYSLGQMIAFSFAGLSQSPAVLNRVPATVALQANRTKRIGRDLFRNLIQELENTPPDLTTAVPDTSTREMTAFRNLPAPLQLGHPNFTGMWLLEVMQPISGTSMVYRRQEDSARRATSLILRLNAYRTDHGAYPKMLSDLVPKYLSEVPLDPMDGKPFRYDRARRIIYSVGRNIRDDGGQGGDNYSDPDWVFSIDGESAPTL